MQDVKCDDGETPPSIPAAPSRMSLHDVTKAFQQVPSSSSSSPSQRSDVFNSATNLTLAPPNYPYPLPPPPNIAIRSPYASYASPVMASSPSPTAIYAHAMTPSPVPTRMPLSTHTPVYNHWMAPGPTPPATMYRPMPSSYPHQLVSFASTNGPTPLYAPPPHALQTPVQAVGMQQSRGRGMQVISPMIQPSSQHVVYSGSPIMVHPQNHNFMSVAATTRGQMRTDHGPAHPQMQTTPSGHPQTSSGFNAVPPTPFIRPTW
jgi:serine/arginine repetitive matrix protein 2